MILYLEGSGHDQQVALALLQEHGFNVSLQSGDIPAVAASTDTAEEGLPLAFLEHSIDGIAIHDLQTAGVIYANKAFAQMLGYSLEEIRQLKVWDWDARWSREELERMLCTGNWPFECFETRHRRKDGQMLDVTISLAQHVWQGKEVCFCVIKDITERKKTERALNLMQLTVEKTGDQAHWLTPEGRFFYANEATCTALGYSREELENMFIWEVDPKITREKYLENYPKLKEEGSMRFESLHRARDGRIYPVEVHCNYIYFDGEEYCCAFSRDISGRKQKEATLRLNKFAMDNTSDQAFWLTPEGIITYANNAACAALGYSNEELVGMSVSDIDPNIPPERLLETWESLKAVKYRRFETCHIAKSGRIYPVEIRSSYVNYDGQELRFAFANDISERKQAEEALRRSEERYRQLMEMLPIAAYTTDAEGGITFFNRKAKSLWQRAPRLNEDLWCGSFKIYYPDGRPMAHDRCPMAITLKNGESCHGQEIMVETPDGSFSHALAYPERLLDADGEVEGAVNLLFDITARKKAEQQLRQANRVLENSPAVVFRWGASDDWPVEMVSGNVTQFGYIPEELLEGSVPYAALVHPEDLDQLVAELRAQVDRGEKHFQHEYRIVTKQGEVRWVDERTLIDRDSEGKVCGYQGIVLDITDRKRTELVIAARLRLLQYAAMHNTDELLEATLNEAEELTGSEIGFYHFVAEDQQALSLMNWSTRTKTEFCKMQGKGMHYPVSEAGVWVDCVRQRRPVIHNDYKGLPHCKGLPPGHAPVVRELVVPVFRGEKIVAVLGVGNKLQAYTQQDVEMVSLLADLAWEIAERKQAEEALRKSERKYRSIVEHAPFGITRSTRDGKLLSANPALASILKYDSAEELMEIINRSSIQEVLFPCPSKREPLVADILSSDTWYKFNNKLRCKDGSSVFCRVHSRRILDKDGQASAFESYQENITDQVEAEQALRESEEKFRVLAETSPVAICLYQGEKFIYTNPAMERLFGFNTGELCGTNFLAGIHEDYKELVRSRAMARLTGETVPGEYEIKCVTKTGEELYLLVSAGTIEYQGRSTGVATFLDITERKRTEELVRASLMEKEVLLKEIHHRVKNNLQVVSSLLFLQAQRFSDPELQACFLESQSRICSMALAHELLYQSKNLSEISVKNYVESLVEQLQQIFLSPGQEEIDCRLEVDDLELDIEKVVPCGLLITELLSNAYKHAFVDDRSGQVTISLQSNANQIELAVADDGVGLPADFDHSQVTTLGLHLVTALANQLGGTLQLDRDAGTCFKVSFVG